MGVWREISSDEESEVEKARDLIKCCSNSR